MMPLSLLVEEAGDLLQRLADDAQLVAGGAELGELVLGLLLHVLEQVVHRPVRHVALVDRRDRIVEGVHADDAALGLARVVQRVPRGGGALGLLVDPVEGEVRLELVLALAGAEVDRLVVRMLEAVRVGLPEVAHRGRVVRLGVDLVDVPRDVLDVLRGGGGGGGGGLLLVLVVLVVLVRGAAGAAGLVREAVLDEVGERDDRALQLVRAADQLLALVEVRDAEHQREDAEQEDEDG